MEDLAFEKRPIKQFIKKHLLSSSKVDRVMKTLKKKQDKQTSRLQRLSLRTGLYRIVFPDTSRVDWGKNKELVTKVHVGKINRFYSQMQELVGKNNVLNVLLFDDSLMNKITLYTGNNLRTSEEYNRKACDRLKKKYPNIFAYYYLIIPLVTDKHRYFVVVDLFRKYFIFFESYKNERFTGLAGQLISKSLLAILQCMHLREVRKTRKKITDRYEDISKWKIMFPNIGKQKDCFNCGFYTLLNIKYLLFEILPSFTDDDMDHMKTSLFYEFTRPTVYPLMSTFNITEVEVSTYFR